MGAPKGTQKGLVADPWGWGPARWVRYRARTRPGYQHGGLGGTGLPHRSHTLWAEPGPRGGVLCMRLGCKGDSIGRWGLRGCTPPALPLCLLSRLHARFYELAPNLVPMDYRKSPVVHVPMSLITQMPELRVREATAAGQVGWGAGSTPLTWVEAGSTVHGCVSLRGSLNLSGPVRSAALSELVCGGCIRGCAHLLPLREMASWLCVAELVCFFFFFQDCVYLRGTSRGRGTSRC